MGKKRRPNKPIKPPSRKLPLLAFAAVALVGVAVVCALAFTHRTPAAPAPSAPISHEAMVFIPAGQFTMGTDDAKSMANERPGHKVQVDGFWLDEHDVTNAQFSQFVKATGYVTTAEKKPVWEEMKK